MTLISKVEEGNVTIEHNSTASLMKVTLKRKDDVESGEGEEIEESIWFEYEQFQDLIKAIKHFES